MATRSGVPQTKGRHVVTTILSTPSAQPVAVVGATGLQGGSTVRALLAAGVAVRALTRRVDSDAAHELTRLGVEVVAADPGKAGSMVAAFTGVRAMFAMTTPGSQQSIDDEIRQGEAIADAAVEAEVAHVVYSSVGGAERRTGIPHFDSKRHVEEYLLAQGLSTTFVRPVFFMDNFAQFMRPTVEDETLVVRMPLPPGIGLQMIAAADVGAVAAAVALDPGRVMGGAVEIAGDELTGELIAEAYGRRHQRSARYEALPLEVLGDNADQQAMFRWFAVLPAYQADFAATRALQPSTLTFAAWLNGQPEI